MIAATKPEIVAVCTPPHFHEEHSLIALEAGCHVFCEKPFTDNLAEADKVIRAAEDARRFVVINNQFPSMRIYQAAKRMIGTADFGRLLFIQGLQTVRPTTVTEAGWRGELSRRVCFEFGVHVFELIRFFFEREPARVFAHMPRIRPQSKSDDLSIISLEFDDGRAASVILNRIGKGPDRYLELTLDGEEASIHTSIGGVASLELGLNPRARRPFTKLRIAKGGIATWQKGNESRVIAREGINPFAAATAVHLGALIDAVESGKEPAGSARDNRKTLALALAAYESAESGRWVDLA
jgi:predicted dehydrogenase